MTLSPGTRLGPYEITAAIGAGGMGEVFRARDTKLNRDVAIKVLPEALAHDDERLARFTSRRSGRRRDNGKRLAVAAASDESGVVRDHVVFFFGFGDYLKRLAPGTK